MKLYNYFKNSSTAYKNAFILIMTLIPFMVGMGISIYRSSDLDYFGNAINISGSERMRTMLISNFSQRLQQADLENNTVLFDETVELLTVEIEKYQVYMDALINGNSELELDKNKYPYIVENIEELYPLFNEYVENAEYLLLNPSDDESLDFIVENSLPLKNKIHLVVGLFEDQNDEELQKQKYLDYAIIVFSICFTALGLTLTRRIKLNEKYATYDFLTGLKTRRVIFEELENEAVENYSAFFIDLDKFKLINDTFGHNIGDEILVEASNRLREIFSPDSVFRYGGDEFLVLRESTNLKDDYDFIEYIGQQVKKVMDEPIVDIKNRSHNISFSMGVVTNNVGMESFSELIDFADDLMYDSKNFKSQIIICDTKEDADFRKTIKKDIYYAFSKNEFEPYFQTIVNNKGKIVGYEALARWNYKGKVIEPKDFIPLLHRTGLIEKLDISIIQSVDEFYNKVLKQNHKDIELNIAINLSKESIYNINSNGLLETLDNLLIPKEHLMLELSEEIVIDSFIIDKIRLLNEKGFNIVLDDFSAGKTAIDSMRIEFLKRIKIDKTIMNSLNSDYQISLLRELVYLMHSMGKTVLVEGVETVEQFNLLKALYVDYFQGYYFSYPSQILPKNIKIKK